MVIGEPNDRRVIRGLADITDPSSPLHADRIGLRTAPVHRSAQITSQHQANTVARSLLIEQSLWSDTAIWSGVPDPTVEAGDVISLIEPQTATDAKYQVDRVSIPVTRGEMSMIVSRVMPLFEAAA